MEKKSQTEIHDNLKMQKETQRVVPFLVPLNYRIMRRLQLGLKYRP